MNVTVTPSLVRGTARAPPSKSYTHRALLAAGYAEHARVLSPLDSADTRATARAVEAYGGDVTRDEDAFTVEGFDGRPETPEGRPQGASPSRRSKPRRYLPDSSSADIRTPRR